MLDISIALAPGTPEWPGDTPYACGWTARIADGSSVNLSAMTLSPHVGTHADAPRHVSDAGGASETLPVDVFLGPTQVVDVADLRGEIELEDLATRGLRVGVVRLLLRTGRSIALGEFPGDWPVLSTDCIRALTTRGLRLLGVDCPSVDARDSKTLDNHHALFGHGAYVLENLELGAVAPGRYELVALPLRVDGLDAAPVRAILLPRRD